MNTLVKGTLLSGAVIVGASAFAIPAFAQGMGRGYMRGSASSGMHATTISSSTSTATLSASEQQTLSYMLEEEKLAHDIYVKLYDAWGVNVFNNISKSETQHQASLASAATYFGLTNPSSSQLGVFTNQDLQNLYNTLLAKGLTSKTAAFEVGKAIEEQDIADLQKAIDQTGSTYLDTVYSRLLKGSQNHLKAFNRQLGL